MSHYNLINLSVYLELLINIGFALLVSAVLLALSHFLSVRLPDTEKTSSYECGFEVFEDARNRFVIKFYIVAILFLVFDVEVAFLFPWALSLAFTGMVGYCVVAFFLVLLAVGFVFEIAKGALDTYQAPRG